MNFKVIRFVVDDNGQLFTKLVVMKKFDWLKKDPVNWSVIERNILLLKSLDCFEPSYSVYSLQICVWTGFSSSKCSDCPSILLTLVCLMLNWKMMEKFQTDSIVWIPFSAIGDV